MPTKDSKKYAYLCLLALLLTLKASSPAGSHSFRFEPVIFDCSELGCLIGRDNSERCKCGPVDLAQELPCGDSRTCACGFEHCQCPKSCNLISDPCTNAQECKSGWNGKTEKEQTEEKPEAIQPESTTGYEL